MVGLFNSSFVYPVLELIKKEVRNQTAIKDLNFLDEIPSVILHRDNLYDLDEVTGASFKYQNGFALELFMTKGSDDETSYPIGVSQSHPDYKYYRYERLTLISSSLVTPDDITLVTVNIELQYDPYSGNLLGTNVYTLK